MSHYPRVWMLIPKFYPVVGGAERQCLKLSSALRRRDVDVQVLTYRDSPDLPPREIIDCVPVIRLPLVRPIELSLAVWTWFLSAHRDKYDILHIHSLIHVHTVAGFWSARAWNKPMIVKMANSGERADLRILRRERWPLRSWIRKSVFSADAVIAICDMIQDELLEAGLDPRRIVTIPNGVEMVPSVNEDLRIQRRRELRLPQDACVVLRVGRLALQKGIGTLLKAWQQVAMRWPNALLVSVGGERWPEELEARAQALSKSVRFVPNQPDGVLPYMQAADIFVLPSLAEGLSNALLEAQACGLACVATRVGGNSDIIPDGKNGLLVDSGSVSQLVQALDTLIADPGLRDRLGRQSVQVASRFDINRVAEQYERLYCDLVGAR